MKISIIENGPILIEAEAGWTWDGESQPSKKTDRIALCRCGGSSHKPFCDGTHHKIGFKAPGGTVELTPR